MRIAVLSDAEAVHTRRWIEWFVRRGHDVRAWSMERIPAGLDVRPLPRAPLPGFARYALAVPALRQALLDFRPDVIDAHYVPNYGLMAVLSGLRPVSVSAWGSDLLSVRDPLRAARARFVLARADLVIADSDNLAAAAVALGGPRDRVHAIPWGIDLARWTMGERREPGLLLSTRMHKPVYDLPTLLQGLAPVLAGRPGARLVVAGDGPLRPSLERLAARLLPKDRCSFVGMLDDAALAGWLARADVYLSASRSDSTSVSLLEAMACGAFPVVSDLEGNREWVRDGEGGRLFACGDPRGIARGVEAVLDDPEWAAAARARNRRVIESRADRATNMARIEALFRSLAAPRRPVVVAAEAR